ncbi:MAG: hypothetical protein Q7K11_00905 [Candidatus Berkelbacteria bacterium]|nr:hypothetical protein [Candidatus Berkelbacteria bacterium]
MNSDMAVQRILNGESVKGEQINGPLHIEGMKIIGNLVLEGVHCSNSLQIHDCEIGGCINLKNAKVDSFCKISNTKIGSLGLLLANFHALRLIISNCTIDGDIHLTGCGIEQGFLVEKITGPAYIVIERERAEEAHLLFPTTPIYLEKL